MRIKLTLSAFLPFALVFSIVMGCNKGGPSGENVNNNNNDPCSNRECGEFEGVSCGTCTKSTETCNEEGQCVDLCDGYDCGHIKNNGKFHSCGECTGATEICKTKPDEGGVCTDYCEDRDCGRYMYNFDCGSCTSIEERCENEFGLCVHVCEERECGSPVDGVVCGECEPGKECGAAGNCYSPSSNCPEGMVEIAGKGYCIDAYEVTNSQYADFLNFHGDDCEKEPHYSLTEDHRCYYQEDTEQIFQEGDIWVVEEGKEQYAAAGVRFVGAKRACEMWGKQLCSLEMWENACSGPEEYMFPYGDIFDPCKCHTGDQTLDCFTGKNPEEVGSYPECEGGYPGLYDMNGNVKEWVDHCRWQHYAYGCVVMGGAAYEPESFGGCFYPQDEEFGPLKGLYSVGYSIGFRCCALLD